MTSQLSSAKSVSNVLPPGVATPYKLSFLNKPVPRTGRLVSVFASATSGDNVPPGGNIRFSIPGKNFLDMQNGFIKFRYRAKSSVLNGGNIGPFPFSSYLINRWSTSIGGRQMDLIQQYGDFYQVMMNNNCPYDYASKDGNVLEAFDREDIGNATANNWSDYVEMVWTLPSILSGDKCLPLLTVDGTIEISIDLIDANKLKSTDAFTFEVSQARLYYDILRTDDTFNIDWRTQAMTNMIKHPYVSIMGANFSLAANQNTFSQNIGFSAKSVLGVLMAIKQNDELDTRDYKNYGFQSATYRVDSLTTPTYTIDGNISAFAELQKMYSNLFDVDATSLIDYLRYSGGSSTIQSKFSLGLNLNRFQDSSMISTGTPVTRGIEIEAKFSSVPTAGAQVYVWVVYEQELEIDPMGNVSVNK